MVDFDMYDDINNSQRTAGGQRPLYNSEYGDIIDLAQKFKESMVKNYYDERNRIFNILVKTAKHREELPSLVDYFFEICSECGGEGCENCYKGYKRKKIGKYKNTSLEMYCLEYVSALEERVRELKDDKINPKRIK